MSPEEYLKGYIITVSDFPIEGVSFKEISPLLANQKAKSLAGMKLEEHVHTLCPELTVAGIDARGFLIGGHVAGRIGMPIIMVRKGGRMPNGIGSDYSCEYGQRRIEISPNLPPRPIHLVDDVLATGETMRAAAKLLESQGHKIISASVLIDLEYLHEPNFEVCGVPVQSVIKFDR